MLTQERKGDSRLNPINFPGANVILQKSEYEDYGPEWIDGVPAMLTKSKSEAETYITAWQPNKEDLEALNAGKPIMLQFYSHVVPIHRAFTVSDEGEIN